MKRIVKFCGVGLASTVLLAAAVAMLLSYDATRRLSKTYEVTVERVAVPASMPLMSIRSRPLNWPRAAHTSRI